MAKIRVLVVDDSSVVRRLITEILNSDAEIEVVGSASNGRIALERVTELKPDLVTLDIEMPELDGLGALVELRKLAPRLPVIMFSTLSQRGAEATLDALAKGANDYVTKPSNLGDMTQTKEAIRRDLVRKIHALCRRDRSLATTALSSTRPPLPSPVAKPSGPPTRIELVAIGVSTGGPNALAAVIPELPREFPVPIVLVQHMPPTFTQYLAANLGHRSKVGVHEGRAGERLQPGHVYIAPGDYHMTVERVGAGYELRTNQNEPENFCRPAVDVLFRSVADVYGSSAFGVILTGMGRDGLVGCHALVQRGARCIAQDEETSVVWGMPGFVAKAGLAEKVLPIGSIANEIIARTAVGRSVTSLRQGA